jgi:hypothetical protein
MELTPALGYIIVALLTLMTLLMTFFIYQQGIGNKKAEKTNDLLTALTNRLIKLETEHEMMKHQCRFDTNNNNNHGHKEPT